MATVRPENLLQEIDPKRAKTRKNANIENAARC